MHKSLGNDNTSIVLAAVHGLSGLFRAASAVEPSLFRPLPNKPPRFCGRKAKRSGPVQQLILCKHYTLVDSVERPSRSTFSVSGTESAVYFELLIPAVRLTFCIQLLTKSCMVFSCTIIIIIIIMYIYHALINALSAHMIHINLNMIFYTHVEHSPCLLYTSPSPRDFG